MRKLIILFFILLSFNSIAQQSSPYSRYGIGQLYPYSLANSRAMGNTTTAFVDSVQTNIANPANLSNKLFSSFDFGMNLNYRSQQDLDNTNNFAEGGVAYVYYSFPVNRNKTWGMGLNVTPYSYKNYDITSDIINDRYIREFEGDGNTYKLAWQNGVKVTKDLSLGVDASLVFGSLEDKSYNTFLSGAAYGSGQILQQKIRGLDFSFGALYNKELGKNLNLTIGGTYDLETDLNNEVFLIDQLFTVSSFEISENDKINILRRAIINEEESTFDNDITIPQKIGVGAFINKKEKWSLGVDAKISDWSIYESVNDGENQSYRNQIELGIGGSFIPNYRNPKKAYEGFEYRYGGYFNQTFLSIENTDINDYGISLGVGLPVRKNVPGARLREIPSSIDVGIMIGQTGTVENNLVQDSYIKGTVGLSLNDVWFQKKKYD